MTYKICIYYTQIHSAIRRERKCNHTYAHLQSLSMQSMVWFSLSNRIMLFRYLGSFRIFVCWFLLILPSFLGAYLVSNALRFQMLGIDMPFWLVRSNLHAFECRSKRPSNFWCFFSIIIWFLCSSHFIHFVLLRNWLDFRQCNGCCCVRTSCLGKMYRKNY